MAKIVEFDGKKIGEDNKQYRLVDTGANVIKAANILKAMTEVSDNVDSLVDSITKTPEVVELTEKGIIDLLGLSSERKKHVLNHGFSYSDEDEFLKECFKVFIGIDLFDDNKQIQEDEDPKLSKPE